MGTVAPFSENNAPTCLHNFQEIQEYNPLERFNPTEFRIIKDNDTGLEIEHYQLVFPDQNQRNACFEMFQWRLRQQHLVNTMYFYFGNQKHLCSTSCFADLYTQRVPIKLEDIDDMPFPQNLYVLHCSLQGLWRLAEKFGNFKPKPEMICFDRGGKVKVWINDNLSKNYPQNGNHDVISQGDMVKQIVSLISKNTDPRTEPESIEEYFRRSETTYTFAKALTLLDLYLQKHYTKLPQTFSCLLDILQSKVVHQSNKKQGQTKDKGLTRKEKLSLRSINSTKQNYPEIQQSNQNMFAVPMCIRIIQAPTNLSTINSRFESFPKRVPNPGMGFQKQNWSVINKHMRTQPGGKKVGVAPQLTTLAPLGADLNSNTLRVPVHEDRLNRKSKQRQMSLLKVPDNVCGRAVSTNTIVCSQDILAQITYRSPNQRFCLDPTIAKDLRTLNI